MKRQFRFTPDEILRIVGNHLRSINEIEDGPIYIEVEYDISHKGLNASIDSMTFTVEERSENEKPRQRSQ